MTLALQGEVVDENEQRIAELEDELNVLRAQLTQSQRASDRAVGELRRQLLPLYNALRAVFGEIDVLVGEAPHQGSNMASPVDSRTAQVWTMWKSRLGGNTAKVIDALLLSGDLNTQQLAIATGMNRNTIPNLIMKLNKAGLINKNGGRFSLKQL